MALTWKPKNVKAKAKCQELESIAHKFGDQKQKNN